MVSHWKELQEEYVPCKTLECEKGEWNCDPTTLTTYKAYKYTNTTYFFRWKYLNGRGHSCINCFKLHRQELQHPGNDKAQKMYLANITTTKNKEKPKAHIPPLDAARIGYN